MAYLILVGISFLIAAAIGDADAIGRYALFVAWSSMLTVALQFGFDRLLLVEVSAAGQFSRSSMRVWANRRAPLLILAGVAAIGSTIYLPMLPAAAAIVSRVILSDSESILIGLRRQRLVSAATIVNGVISAVSLIGAADHGINWLMWSASIGNFAALMFVALMTFRAKEGSDTEHGISASWSDALPFGGMSIAGVVYQRADIAVLALAGISTKNLATYAIASRAFDILVAFRGAVVQSEASEIARNRTSMSESLHALTRSASRFSTLAGLAAILSAVIAAQSDVLSDYPHLFKVVAMIGVVTPLIASHVVTSSWIYSRPGTLGLFATSVALSVAAVSLTLAAGLTFGLVGAAVALGLKEYMSFLVFRSHLRRIEVVPLRLATLNWAGCSIALALVYALVDWGGLLA